MAVPQSGLFPGGEDIFLRLLPISVVLSGGTALRGRYKDERQNWIFYYGCFFFAGCAATMLTLGAGSLF